eukprot:6075117-Amphidinium_carterae.1
MANSSGDGMQSFVLEVRRKLEHVFRKPMKGSCISLDQGHGEQLFETALGEALYSNLPVDAPEGSNSQMYIADHQGV